MLIWVARGTRSQKRQPNILQRNTFCGYNPFPDEPNDVASSAHWAKVRATSSGPCQTWPFTPCTLSELLRIATNLNLQNLQRSTIPAQPHTNANGSWKSTSNYLKWDPFGTWDEKWDSPLCFLCRTDFPHRWGCLGALWLEQKVQDLIPLCFGIVLTMVAGGVLRSRRLWQQKLYAPKLMRINSFPDP